MSGTEPAKVIPIAVFLSGSGRTLANLIHHRDEHGLPIDIRLVIGSRSNLRGIEIAQEHDIPTQVIRQRDFADPDQYSDAMFQPVRSCGADHVVMAGFLKHVLIPADFENRVINIHPSLLPKYGGEGMYGHHVHSAVIAAGESTSGCTVHFVDNLYDNGPVLHQRSCPVLANDTPDILAARVFEQECEAMPEALWKLAAKQ